MGKHILYINNQKKAGVTIFILDKVDFTAKLLLQRETISDNK